MGAPQAGLHHEAGAPAFLAVGNLVGENSGEGFRGHPRARKNPGALQERRRGDHHHGIAARGEPDLEQERDVEDDNAFAPRRGAAEERALHPAHERVNDRLQTAKLHPVPEHPLAQYCPVDGTVPHHAGEGFADGIHRGAAQGQQGVHRGIGIVDRQAELAKHARRGRLSHPDGAGEADDHHAGQPSRSAATWRRSASSTTGSAPYQAAKPGRA